MPVMSPLQSFMETLVQSKLLSEKQLESLRQQLASQPEARAEAVASALVKKGLLTDFQARLLLQGKFKGFILGGRYKLLDRLGAGGMGSVYLCEHIALQKLVALKVLPEDKLQAPGALERFQREARAIAQLDHPNIVKAYDLAQERNLHYLVMDYVDGINLELLVLRHYPQRGLPVARAVNYVCQAAAALQHAHELGWVHRDIKPANIIVDRAGVVKLLDLGLSRLFKDDQQQVTVNFDQGAVLGTADYISPEQAINMSQVDIRGDIYSLGCTLYFLLAGRPPFDGTLAQKLVAHQSLPPPSLRSSRADIPEELEAVVLGMMAKRREDRPQTPLDVIQALSPWQRGDVPPPSTTELPLPPPRVRQLLPQASTTARQSVQATLSSASLPLPENGPPSAASRVSAKGGVRKKSSSPSSSRWLVIAGASAAAILGIGLLAVLLWPKDGSPPVANAQATNPQSSAGRPAPPGSTPTPRPATHPLPNPSVQPPNGPPTGKNDPTGKKVIDGAEARQYVGQNVTVRFRVQRIGSSNTLYFLNSEVEYTRPTNFTVVIPKQTVESFQILGITVPDSFEGKVVEVQGEVTIFAKTNSVQIRVERPEQIRIVNN